MSNGNYSTGNQNVIHFKCTKCGFIDTMEKDIAYEVLEVTHYKGKKCFYAYCIKCDSKMYPNELMKEKQKN